MFDFIREYQLDIMTGLISVCIAITLLLIITRFLPIRRRLRLILMEVVAAGLLFFDRMAYIYSGDTSQTGFIMVRLSNFMVFFLTSGIVFAYNLYVMGLFESYVRIDKTPLRMKIVAVMSVVGMLMSIISQFTDLYYYFDEANKYHRGQGFIISYIIPIICPIVTYTAVFKYRKYFSRFILIALTAYVVLPITMGIIQVFAYGVSIVNMAMVLVSISLYVFTYLDINDEVERAHKVELENANEEMSNMKRLFEQTTTAFVDAVEKRDPLSKGHSLRVAKLARQLAKENGKSEEECDEVYYTALLHNVGMVSISDRILEKGMDLTDEENEEFKKQPVVSSDILSGITVFPYLSRGARYVSERYDGSGYPDGLKGEAIPEVSRILAIADVYDGMKTESRSSEPLPDPIIREEFVEGSGTKYDPKYSEIMIHMIDSEIAGKKKKHSAVLEKEISCGSYRDTISSGIQVLQSVSKISFKCECEEERAGFFSAPSIILFDSYDSCVHSSDRSIEAYHYVEYGEVWFDGHIVSTRARNTSVDVKEKGEVSGQITDKSGEYVIMAAKYEDHIRLVMESPSHSTEVIVSLPDSTKSVYIALTGENCHLSEIDCMRTERLLEEGDIARISDSISYINRIESDIPNVQVDSTRSAATIGIPIRDRVHITFHTMSLPTASLVWHCPYFVLFSSDDKKVGGPEYREYAVIKLNGENEGSNEYAENRFVMKKTAQFVGWNDWKQVNKQGMEVEVEIVRKGDRITFYSENLGVMVENTTILHEPVAMVYAAITGDECAITDIRIR